MLSVIKNVLYVSILMINQLTEIIVYQVRDDYS